MFQSKQWLKMGREYGKDNKTTESLNCFDKACLEAPCWSLPYLFSGIIYLRDNQIDRAESLFAVARTLVFLKSHPPIKTQICDIWRKGESACRSKSMIFSNKECEYLEGYASTSHLSISPEIFADDVVQEGSFPYIHEECIVTEKLDGGNCCLDFSCGLVFARTHGHEANHDSFGPVKTFFRSLQSSHASLVDLLESKGVKLFGENMFGIHSIEYSHVGSVFYAFAAYGRCLMPTILGDDSPRWYSWNEVEALSELLGIPTVPVVRRGSFESMEELQRLMETLASRPSALNICPTVDAIVASSTNCMHNDQTVSLPEGFVIRTSRGFSRDEFSLCVAKYVRKNHVQTDPSWRRTWKKATVCNSCRDAQIIVLGRTAALCSADFLPTLIELDRDDATLLTSVPFIKSAILAHVEIKRNTAIDICTALDIGVGFGFDSLSGRDIRNGSRALPLEDPLLVKFPRTSHLLVAGKGQGVTRDDLILEGEDKACFFHAPVIVQEKVDGANIGISITPNYEIRVQNRSHYVCGETSSQFKSLDSWINRHREELMEILRPGRDILYGEWLYARHSVPYDGLPDYFLAFDLFDRLTGNFVSVRTLSTLLADTSIKMVPLVGVFEFKTDLDVLDLLRLPSSCQRRSKTTGKPPQLVEGVYLRIEKDESLHRRSKVVREDFIQTINDGQHWSRRKIEKNSLMLEK